MPNTLIHLGLQGLATRAAWRGADLGWVFAGCVIPDLPWIARRAWLALAPPADLLGLQVAAGIQSSLFFCLALCAALALATERPGRTFALLGVTSLGHLLLDAAEIKWANGALLAAPWSWALTNYGALWPDSAAVIGLTVACAVTAAFLFLPAVRGTPQPVRFQARPGAGRAAGIAALLALYLAAPPLLRPSAEAADLYYARTLRERADRTGRAIAFDRAPCAPAGADEVRLTAANGEVLTARGFGLDRPALVSVEGRFEAPDRLKAGRWHVHAAGSRDLAAHAGIGVVGLAWLLRLARARRRDDA